MKKLGKLKLKNVADVLSNDQMKKVTGGSYICYRRKGTTLESFEPYSLNMGAAWCEFWEAAGWTCSCGSNGIGGYIYV